MKRSPLKRKTQLRRARMRRKAKSTKYGRRPRAPKSWFDFVRSIGCVIPVFGTPRMPHGVSLVSLPCSGPMEANHGGERIAGLGTKSKDRDCFGMCQGHHIQWTTYRGLFAGMTHGERREYAAACIKEVHDRAWLRGIEVPEC